MEKVFFKIILPNYNNMPFIKECLDSVMQQTYKNFKLIIVDDQSTDLSDKFCKMYADKYPSKIIFIKAEKKLYAGGCRNIAIKYPIESEYTLFIDGDDYFESNQSLYFIHEQLKDFNYDILLFQAKWVNAEGKLIFISPFRNINDILAAGDLLQSQYNSLWTRAIRSSLMPLCLENCMFGEDTFTWVNLCKKGIKIKQINKPFYVYRKQSNSVTHTPGSMHFKSIVTYISGLQKEFFKNKENTILRKQIAKLIFRKRFINDNEFIPQIKDYNETLDELINSDKSFIRFGDGELHLCTHKKGLFESDFSKYTEDLKAILNNDNNNIMVGIPKCYFYSYPGESKGCNGHVEYILNNKIDEFKQYINKDIVYYDSYTTIIPTQVNKNFFNLEEYYEKIRNIFKDKDILLVTGDLNIITWQHDTFKYAKSFNSLVYDLPRDASKNYDQILSDVIDKGKNKLVVMVFGQLGKIIGYKIANENNIRVIDMGHYFKIYNELVKNPNQSNWGMMFWNS